MENSAGGKEKKMFLLKIKFLLKVAFLLLIIITISAAFFFFSGSQNEPEKEDASSVSSKKFPFSFFEKNKAPAKVVIEESIASLNLKYGDNSRWFDGELAEGMTALDVLETASITGKFELQTEAGIISLDGFSKGDLGEWKCYINGDLINELLSQKLIKSGDNLFCQYISKK